jgi:outer membrane lipoprotein-sorting protein
VRYVNYLLWRDMADRETRKEATGKLNSILFTLKNSVLNNMGEDRERIKNMVNWAVDEMKKLYDRVKDVSITAAGFIRRASNRAVTFARVCYEKGRLIPWNNNLIERLMGELAKRIKHK